MNNPATVTHQFYRVRDNSPDQSAQRWEQEAQDKANVAKHPEAPSANTPASLLTAPTQLPRRSVATIAQSPILVVAPHPDDETLGCGGAIALLRQMGCDVRVLVISNGTMSHPNSRKYPARSLQALRERETREALSVIGVDADAVTFLRLQDGAVPTGESPDVKGAVEMCRAYLETVAPKIILAPWRCDPHPDHRASWTLIRTALLYLLVSPRLIEYPIWDWDQKQQGSVPSAELMTGWRLDISAVVALKQQAIAAYRSQTTDLIDDDPEGFRLSSEMLANFTRPWEVYFEEVP